MTSEPICPKCGAVVEQFDTVEEYYDDDVFRLMLAGECPICSRQYRWYEVYRYCGVKDLEEVI